MRFYIGRGLAERWLQPVTVLLLLLTPVLMACAGPVLSRPAADAPAPEAASAPADGPVIDAASAPAPAPSALPASEVLSSDEAPVSVGAAHPLIGVIAGHGGPDSGAVHRDPQGVVDLAEKDLTLAVARRLRELLQLQGRGVVLDRDGDLAVAAPGDDRNDDGVVDDADDIQARLDRLGEAGADLLVSIHFNGFDSPAARGTATYYCSDRPFADQNRRLAVLAQQAIIDRLRAAGAEVLDRGVQDDSVLGKPYGHLMTLGPETPKIMRPGGMPGVLVEPLFMTNEYEAGLLEDPAILEAIAQGLAQAIQVYLAPGAVSASTAAATPTATLTSPPQAASKPDTATEIVRGPTGPQVGFTFDLGSGARNVPAILDALTENGIKATFFFTGQWVEANPSLSRRIIELGHEPGNHSFSHPDFTTISDQEIMDEIARTETALQKATGRSPKPWFRPPFGARNARVLGLMSRLGYRSIYWTLDSADWRPELPAATIRDRVITQTTPGAIIVMHGDSPQTAEMLDAEIAGLRARGLEPVSLSRLLGD
ncbi:MAG: N-acetylmuramoyl-L-alanine amidase [Dehalococcoidia bacterium]|nr:N-acetylmuramoyl-L-alanine amidase [Dehalococcoidia bacterium]